MHGVHDIARRIREAVRAAGYTSDSAFCKAAGLNRTTFSTLLPQLEKDPLAVQLSTLWVIARTARVPLHELLFGARVPTPERSPLALQAAELARLEGVWPEAIRSRLADPPLEREAWLSIDMWKIEFKAREVQLLSEAQARLMHRPIGAPPESAARPVEQTQQIPKVEKVPPKKARHSR